MKAFNPEKELRKVQKGNKNKIIIGVIALLIIIAIGSSYALYQVRYSKRIIYTKVADFGKDLNLAVYVNGVKQSEVPQKDSGYTYVGLVCDKGEVLSTWNIEKWELELLSTIPIPNKCNTYFINKDYSDYTPFNYTGDVQEFTVLRDGIYKIELWGAAGGRDLISPSTYLNGQGYGGYTSGIISLKQNVKLYFYVGEKGSDGTPLVSELTKTSYNGGGAGMGDIQPDDHDSGGAGGGATDVRLVKGNTWDDFNSLKSRIMVAGGGAGAATIDYNYSFHSAGSGGGLTGVGESWHWKNIKLDERFNATQTTGCNFGSGCNGLTSVAGGSGGGGGYYGGYADNITTGYYGGAGGGSSYISGHQGCDAITETSTEGAITHTGQSIHYSKYVFTNTIMIDGLGYEWTDKQGNYVGMPTIDGTDTMEGNNDNGYAKITYLGPAN